MGGFSTAVWLLKCARLRSSNLSIYFRITFISFRGSSWRFCAAPGSAGPCILHRTGRIQRMQLKRNSRMTGDKRDRGVIQPLAFSFGSSPEHRRVDVATGRNPIQSDPESTRSSVYVIDSGQLTSVRCQSEGKRRRQEFLQAIPLPYDFMLETSPSPTRIDLPH